jgi:hypothetical protein
MELNMAGFLLTPGGDLPLGLIKALRIPPGLRLEQVMTHGASPFFSRLSAWRAA